MIKNGNIKQISCGWSHTFILMKNDAIFSCGDNSSGQFGLDFVETPQQFNIIKRKENIKQISCGGRNTFILMENNDLFSCGCNYYGQLGTGQDKNDIRTKFQKVPRAEKMEGNIKQISCGGDHTFILMDNNDLFSCGSNEYGQLGFGYASGSISVYSDRFNEYYFPSFFRKVSKVDGIEENIKQIICNWEFTFILTEGGHLFSCGLNNYGQFGLGHNNNQDKFKKVEIEGKIKQISCGQSHTFILIDNNQLFSCGENNFGQLGLGHNNDVNIFQKCPNDKRMVGNIKKISCGYGYTFILMEDGQLFSCGLNECGQLGLGNNLNQNSFQKVEVEGKIKEISCGYDYTFILMEDGQLFSCGSNKYGQLGLGHNENQNRFVKVPKIPSIIDIIKNNNTIINSKKILAIFDDI